LLLLIRVYLGGGGTTGAAELLSSLIGLETCLTMPLPGKTVLSLWLLDSMALAEFLKLIGVGYETVN